MTSLFGGGSSLNVNASGTLVPQQFTAINGQTLFTITNFTYTQNTNSLLVWLNGVKQIVIVDFTETSTSSFTFLSPLIAGDIVDIIGFPLATIQVLNTNIADGSITTTKLAAGAVTIGKTTGVAASGVNTDITSITGNAATATSVAWSGVTNKPTTVVGYGITDMGSQSVNYASSAGNGGVTSIVAGSGISVSGATGDVTVTSTSTVTTAAVGAAMAGLAYGDIGTTMYLTNNGLSGGALVAGTSYAGSLLQGLAYTFTSGSPSWVAGGSTMAGTWKALTAKSAGAGGTYPGALFTRIA